MSRQYRELDTLRSFTATINSAITGSTEPRLFADLLAQHDLISKTSGSNIVSPQGLSDYNKISKLVSVVYSYVQTVSTQEQATTVFNKFVLIIHNDLKLKELAEQLVEHCGNGNSKYTSPISCVAAPGDEQVQSLKANDSGSSAVTIGTTSSIDIMQERPTILQLTILKDTISKRVEIIKSVAGEWKKFGVHLDFDETGKQLNIFELQYAGRSPEDACVAMFQYWLEGNGVKATWGKLIEILEDFEESTLATDLKKILELKFSQSGL